MTSIACYPAFKNLEGKRTILASTSLRRIDLFKRMGLDFEAIPSKFEENYAKSSFSSPSAYCTATCLKKTQIVKDMTIGSENPPSLIVGSDTIIVCEEEIYEKPTDRTDAVRMLTQISGKTVKVITAVAIFYRIASDKYESRSFEDVTLMHMERYDLDMINAYLDMGEGINVAGALSYQGGAFLMVKGITGCFYNLIGFPALRFYQEISKISHIIH